MLAALKHAGFKLSESIEDSPRKLEVYFTDLGGWVRPEAGLARGVHVGWLTAWHKVKKEPLSVPDG